MDDETRAEILRLNREIAFLRLNVQMALFNISALRSSFGPNRMAVRDALNQVDAILTDLVPRLDESDDPLELIKQLDFQIEAIRTLAFFDHGVDWEEPSRAEQDD